MRPAFKLRDKLLLTFTCLILFIIGGVLLLLNARLKSVSLQALEAELANTLSVFQNVRDERSGNLAAQARLVAGLPRLAAALDVKNDDPVQQANTVSELCLELQDTVRADFFMVVNKKGRVLYDAFRVPEVIRALREGREPDPAKIKQERENPVMASDWPNVLKALEGATSQGALLYTFPKEGTDGHKVAFQTVTVPIKAPVEFRNLGVLILGYALDRPLAGRLKHMTESEVAFSLGGRVLASSWDDTSIPSLEEALAPAAQEAEAWRAQNTTTRSFPLKFKGETHLALFDPFPDLKGELSGAYVILRSLDKALALQRTLQRSILILGLLGVALTFGLSIVIAGRITSPLTALSHAAEEVGKGIFTGKVAVQSRDELGVLADAFNKMMAGLREKDRVTSILGKYVSPEVAHKILSTEGGISLQGERRECVVLFSDIRGFTAFSENMPPEKLVADLNEYFGRMVDTVFEYEGTLDKFIGDAIMAVWGAPVLLEDKELRSVRCALAMQASLAALNGVRTARGAQPLTMGIGLNVGVVVSGNLGSERRVDYTVIGEEVNLASRLCSKALPGQVLISEAMYKKLKGLVEVRALEPVSLKGFSEPVRVYEVTAVIS